MLFELFYKVAGAIVDFVHTFGYLGIFFMTFIESTFIPIPSEITLIPAGYLIYQKQVEHIPLLYLYLIFQSIFQLHRFQI